MVQTWPTLGAYFDYCADANARERHQRDEYARSLTDPALQCEHGVSLYESCRQCPTEAELAAQGTI